MTTAHRVHFPSLVWAESRRARQTRATVAVMGSFTALTLTVLVIYLILNRNSDTPVGADLITMNTDVVGFGVLLATALAVAKDYGTGANDLLRLLDPSRARQLVARAAGAGIVALAAVGIVIAAGLGTVLVLNPSALVSLDIVDSIARTALTTFLLACAGIGIGALTRSSAAATFVVITLYLLLPIGLIIAGLAGVDWADGLTHSTLAMLGVDAISAGTEHWVAVGGVALWAAGLAALGVLRETKGR